MGFHCPSSELRSELAARRCRRAVAAPGRSALFTANTSATSMMPALIACASSPIPGEATNTAVSAIAHASTSDCPTPTVSMMTTIEAGRIHGADRAGNCLRDAAERTPTGHGSDEDVAVELEPGHSNAITQQDTARTQRTGIDRQHRDTPVTAAQLAYQGSRHGGLCPHLVRRSVRRHAELGDRVACVGRAGQDAIRRERP